MNTKFNLTGKRFGRWVVIRFVQSRKGGRFWLCKCDCGTEKEIATKDLNFGERKSCGCYQREYKFVDLAGKRYGRLTVLHLSSKRGKKGQRYWVCRCDCGVEKEILRGSLVNGTTVSCGCYNRENASKRFRIESGLSSKKQVYNRYISQSKERNFSFELSFDQFIYLTQRDCHYCGSKPGNLCNKKYGNFRYNGIDRIDSSKGYTLDNVVSCCYTCNKAKGKLSYTEFMEWIDKLAKKNGYEKTINKSRRLDSCQEKLMNC